MSKTAYVFAGQGAQTVGMGRDLYQVTGDRCQVSDKPDEGWLFKASEAVRDVFDAGEALLPGARALCFNGPAEELNRTVNTQPCVFLTDLAFASALASLGVRADGAAGFSLGEVAAVSFAGIMPFARACAFIAKRADAMRRRADANPGAMFAVLRLSVEDVESVCASLERAYPVNYNCPGQTVVACAAETAETLKNAVAAKGGRALRLSVSGAFHSPFMDEASRELRIYLENESFFEPNIPVYANKTALPYGDAADLLSSQVNSPVLWQKTIENMINDEFDTFIEVGPGAVLAGLIGKIDARVRAFSVNSAEMLGAAMKGLAKC